MSEADIKAAEAVWYEAARKLERSSSPSDADIAAEQKASEAVADLKGEREICIQLGCRTSTAGTGRAYCTEHDDWNRNIRRA
jgi:hypothetical protein